MYFIRNALLLILLLTSASAFCQQDIDLYVTDHYLSGKKIFKVYKNISSPYVWALGTNNQVFRIDAVNHTFKDFTAQFLSFDTYQFIDIVSPDDQTVFVATNQPYIIILQNGSTRSIGPEHGIVGDINSLGLFLKSNYFYFGNGNLLRIGTSKGWANYDIDNDHLDFYQNTAPEFIFEQNYRAGIYENSPGQASASPDIVTIDINTSSIATPLTIVGGSIWRNGKYGQPVTAYYSFPDLFLDGETDNYLINLYWGSEMGLFENRLVVSNSQNEIKQYLTGVKVNKINNIYGLTSFGSQYFRSNLLVGTESGLYFSTSTVNLSNVPGDLRFTHLDQLGNISVNDIETSVASINHTDPLVDCEDGAWLATNNGVYFIKPDYAQHTPAKIPAITFKDQPAQTDTLQVCAVTGISALIDNTIIGNNSVQWFKDGKSLDQESGTTLNIVQPGDYNVVIYDPCSNIHIETNHLVVNVTSTPVFNFNYPDEIRYCDGTRFTLKASGNKSNHYRWYTDGVLNGDTATTLSITQSGKYSVEVSVCAGSWVSSKQVQVDLTQLPVPAIATDKVEYCAGDNATLSVPVPANPSYTINWYRDNVLLSENINLSKITTNIAGSYTASVTNNAVNSDGSICSQTSAIKSLVFNSPPTVSIEKIVKTTLCEGQTIFLLAQYSGGTAQWSTGETVDQINVTEPGNYKVTITSPAGCIADANIDVAFLSNPIFSVKDTFICTYKHQAITLTAPSGYAQYAWNGVQGTQTYQVNSPQTVSLTVTDANGCQATRPINVIDQCPNIWIPNTFTPNNDGINDTWTIEGLDKDLTVSITVFNRYGLLVFESKGYGISWNGEYRGKKLPAGTYYYIIITKNGTQKLSGSVTIIY